MFLVLYKERAIYKEHINCPHELLTALKLIYTFKSSPVYTGKRGIAPTRNYTHLLKNVLNLFVCIKLSFFLTIFLSYLIYSLGGYNRNKTRPRRPRIKF